MGLIYPPMRIQLSPISRPLLPQKLFCLPIERLFGQAEIPCRQLQAMPWPLLWAPMQFLLFPRPFPCHPIGLLFGQAKILRPLQAMRWPPMRRRGAGVSGHFVRAPSGRGIVPVGGIIEPVRVSRRLLLGAPVPCAATCSGSCMHGQGRPALRCRSRLLLLYPSPFGRPWKRRLTAAGASARLSLLQDLPGGMLLSTERPVCAG